MLSSVTFDFGSGDLAIDLDGSDSATALVTNGQVEVSINGTPTGDMPYTSDVYSITVTAGDGDHDIDLSGLQPVEFSYLPLFTTITTGAGEDTVTGTGMMDSIDIGDGNDQVDGHGGDDSITGGPGEDVLSGGTGWDSIFGGDGNDTLWSGSGVPDGGTSALDGGAGDDLLDGEQESETTSPGETGESLPGDGGEDDSLPGDGGEDDSLPGDGGADDTGPPVFTDGSTRKVKTGMGKLSPTTTSETPVPTTLVVLPFTEPDGDTVQVSFHANLADSFNLAGLAFSANESVATNGGHLQGNRSL